MRSARVRSSRRRSKRLAARELVRRLERRPGQKEARYAQLLGGGAGDGSEAAAPAAPADPLEERVARLESEVAELRARLDAWGD